MGTVVQGVLGANFAFRLLNMAGAKSPLARGFSVGSTAHALGTTTAYAEVCLHVCAHIYIHMHAYVCVFVHVLTYSARPHANLSPPLSYALGRLQKTTSLQPSQAARELTFGHRRADF